MRVRRSLSHLDLKHFSASAGSLPIQASPDIAFSDTSTTCSPHLHIASDSFPKGMALARKSAAKEKYESSPLGPLMTS